MFSFSVMSHVLPVWVAKVNERNSSPTNAIIIALVVGIFFAILSTYVNVANIASWVRVRPDDQVQEGDVIAVIQ